MIVTALRRASIQRLLLVDGIGALISALMLGLVLTTWEPAFGMPSRVLLPLAGAAALFAVYSLAGHFASRGRTYLLVIAVANSLYCVVTLSLMFAHRNSLTLLGLAYFAGEVLLVMALVAVEIAAVRRASMSA